MLFVLGLAVAVGYLTFLVFNLYLSVDLDHYLAILCGAVFFVFGARFARERNSESCHFQHEHRASGR